MAIAAESVIITQYSAFQPSMIPSASVNRRTDVIFTKHHLVYPVPFAHSHPHSDPPLLFDGSWCSNRCVLSMPNYGNRIALGDKARFRWAWWRWLCAHKRKRLARMGIVLWAAQIRLQFITWLCLQQKRKKLLTNERKRAREKIKIVLNKKKREKERW